MGIFSDFFKNRSADKVSEETQQEPSGETIDESDVIGEVSYKVDGRGDIYIICEWAKSSDIPAFSELLWMVSNGGLLDETLEFIKEACLENDDEEQYIALLYSINTIMKTHLENFDNKKEDKSDPLIKPTQVMTQTLDGEIS